MFKSILCAGAVACMAATGAVASSVNAFTIDISGTSGTGQTTWLFGGSVTADDDGFFDYDENLNARGVFLNIGDFTTLDDLEVNTVTGDAALSIGAVSRDIDLVYVDGDATAGGDDLAVGVTGSSFFSFVLNDILALSGSLLVTGIDISDLAEGGLPYFATTQTLGFSDATIPVNLSIRELASVPLPAGLPLLVAGLGGLCLLRTRKAA